METMAAKDAASASPLDRRQAPLLLFDYGRETTTATDVSDADFIFYSIPMKQLLIARSEVMRDHIYWITPQGWLLMTTPAGSPDTFLWDPFTDRRVDLPPDTEGFLKGDGRKRCLLSRKFVTADDADLLVLVVDLTDTVLWHCRLGGNGRWLRHEYKPAALGASRGSVLASMSTHLTTVDDRFFLYFFDKVVTLEFSAEPVFSVFPVVQDRASSPPCNGNSTSQLVESGGVLFSVRFCYSDFSRGRFVEGIGVFKLDLSARSWVKVESLDGRAFIVHPSQFGASQHDPQEVGLKGDCIYYCMPNEKALHVYDMQRGTTGLHNPGPCLLDHHSPKVLMPTR